MTRPWLPPLVTVLLACGLAVLAAAHVAPPAPSVPVCEYAAANGPHGAEAMTCWTTTTEGDQ